MDAKVRKIMKDIKSLKVQGARDVAMAAIECFYITTKKTKAKTKKKYLEELNIVKKAILKLRPTEPLTEEYLNLIIERIAKFESTNLILTKNLGERLCNEYREKLGVEIMQISRNGANQIEDGDVILLHCHSDSVIMALKEAKNQKKKFEVIVTETRPKYQGIETAKEVKSIKGINVIYVVDAAIGSMMKKATKAVIGCDAILPDGSVINKIGSFPLAVVAMQFGKPFIVIGESGKYSDQIPEIEQRDPKEIIQQRKIPGVKIKNPAFDIVPAEFITCIVTERGVIKPENAKVELEF